MSDALDAACRHYGITNVYTDDGPPRAVPEATRRLILAAMGLDVDAPRDGPDAPTRPAVPDGVRCFMPASLETHPGWGLFCQLYELRSGRNWGIGDFADLAAMARIAAAAGADFLGVNPVHALFLADPGRRSPFSPSNRRFLNPLYIAVDHVPGHDGTEPEGVDALRASDLVDYFAVARAKTAALRTAFDGAPFGPAPYDREAYDAFVAAEGEPLAQHALFEVISGIEVAAGRGAGWRGWPVELHGPRLAAAREIAEARPDDVAFQVWLQWIARVQLAGACSAARDAGMRIGLYLDLAVGEMPDGSATWSGASAPLAGLSVGAPPDVFATEGQNWGLSAPSPTLLRAADYAPFRDMIRTQLRSAGALRIDHAMALWQLFLIPEGLHPSTGTHLRYPLGDLMRVLAEESHENRAVIIGEDLGWVPDGFREAMAEARVLAYRILYFEQHHGRFDPPEHYPATAMACLSTHDLPVLSRWWSADDIALRRAHGLVDEAASDTQAAGRAGERAAMLDAFRAAGVLGPGDDPATDNAMPLGVLAAAYRFIARTPCRLAAVRLADLAGPDAPTNLPGTVYDYPNWCPRSPTPIEDIAALPAFTEITDILRAERPRPGPAERPRPEPAERPRA